VEGGECAECGDIGDSIMCDSYLMFFVLISMRFGFVLFFILSVFDDLYLFDLLLDDLRDDPLFDLLW
jgi:hypothetical protein